MKRALIGILVAGAVVRCACALTPPYTFSFPTAGNDLDHNNYYFWGIKWDVPLNEEISSATLTFHNIWDWTGETDHLYVDLFNSATDTGVRSKFTTTQWNNYLIALLNSQNAAVAKSDSQGGGDNFGSLAGAYRLRDWNDPVGGYARNYDLVINIPTDHLGWLADGNFGFGIDPDCHYYTDGIELVIETTRTNVPDAGTTASLFGLALVGLAGFRRFLRA